ncbi:MAG TPA: TRAP transporter small permease [Hyphomicrobiaceae bacterium]|jgi:TRAP-type C4-dicarboxylate transport system permease small subunit
MRDIILTIERHTTGFAMWCAGLMLVIASLAGFYQIISRFVLEQPAEWSEVTVRFSLIWMVFLGIPTAFRQGAMLSVDLLYRKSGPRLRRALDWVIFLASLVLMLAILGWGYDYTYRTRFQTIPGLEFLTMVWAYSAMPVGAAFSLLAILGQLLDPRHRELETAQ